VSLPTDYKERKGIPIITGCFDYFPDALAAVARLSKKANEKHNPGEPLHWSKNKSNDHADCLGRHLADRGTFDEDMQESHTVHVAWRALALLQTEIEQKREQEAQATAFYSEAPSPSYAKGTASVHECPGCYYCRLS
jgi:hypothetical protein